MEYEHVILVLIMDHCQPYENNSLNSVYSRPSLCSFMNKWYFPYETKINFFVLMRMISPKMYKTEL